MRWKKIGDTFYAYGAGHKVTIYPIGGDEARFRVQVYMEPGGRFVCEDLYETMAAAKRWASKYLKGTK